MNDLISRALNDGALALRRRWRIEPNQGLSNALVSASSSIVEYSNWVLAIAVVLMLLGIFFNGDGGAGKRDEDPFPKIPPGDLIVPSFDPVSVSR